VKRLKLAGALALLALAASTQAAIVTVSGVNFDLRYDDAQLSLFGTPTLAGNTVFFTPGSFVAQSTNGAGLRETAADVTIELVARNGFAFNSIGVGALGDYRLLGNGSRIEVDGGISVSAGGNTAQAGLLVDASTPLNLVDGQLHDWRASSGVDSGTASWLPTATSLLFTLDQVLRAYTDPTEAGIRQAFVEHKFSGLEISVGGQAVPGAGTA
jgi:hypothetical protein